MPLALARYLPSGEKAKAWTRQMSGWAAVPSGRSVAPVPAGQSSTSMTPRLRPSATRSPRGAKAIE